MTKSKPLVPVSAQLVDSLDTNSGFEVVEETHPALRQSFHGHSRDMKLDTITIQWPSVKQSLRREQSSLGRDPGFHFRAELRHS